MSSLVLHLGPIDAALLKSGHQKCSIKKPVLKNFRNIHRKTPLIESLFNKVTYLQTCNFIQKGRQRKCLPANIAKFLRASILKNFCERLLLTSEYITIYYNTFLVIGKIVITL